MHNGEQPTFDAAQLAGEVLSQNPVLGEKIAQALGIRQELAPLALREAVRFMYLVAHNHSGRLTPSHRVDLAWHEFILCTRVYQEFCETNFGRMIHHFPGGSTRENRFKYVRTLQHYAKAFGKPDEFYWGSLTAVTPTDCGACESF